MTAPAGGRVAVVTGAGRGIGRAHALELAGHGVAVIVNDVGAQLDGSGTDPTPAESVAAEITSAGGRAQYDTTDISSMEGGRHLIDHALDAFGRIDIVINNAGFARGGGTIAEPVPAELNALLAVHFIGTIGTMSAAFPHMVEQRWGRIVNTVSEVALDPRFAAGLGYSVAKAAVWSATLVAAHEGASHGITVNAISPGARTRMNAELLDSGFREGASQGLDLDPTHIARIARFLASDEASDVSGRILHVAGSAIREYTTRRSADTELVRRADAWARSNGSLLP